MLEALQDIEIASRLVGFDADNDDSIDDKYKKLQCEMVPLPHDSEDYRLVEKYLQTTHAPTHTVCLLSTLYIAQNICWPFWSFNITRMMNLTFFEGLGS